MATTIEPSTSAAADLDEQPGDTGSGLPLRTIALGTLGSLLMLVSAIGAGAFLVHDPIVGTGPLSWVRYGHGQMLATAILYLGFALIVWAWVRLGRHVLAGRVGARAVLVASACWIVPLLISPPLFTRDVFSYLAEGALPLAGQDPYVVGPVALGDSQIALNVHPFWQTTPAPYGPAFILLAKGVAWLTGDSVIAGVIVMRLSMLIGLGLLVWAMPRLTRHLGGRLPVSLWLTVAGPMTVVHLIGGPHNDLLMIGFLAAGTVCVLDRRHVLGVALIATGVAVKATAAIALPFLVWVWAGHLKSTFWRNFARATGCAVATTASVFAMWTVAAGVDLGWISSLKASSNIVNWLSLPTGVGEFFHALVGVFVDTNKTYFITVTRIIGGIILLVIMVRQWWAAREGGTDAVRRAAVVLLAFAVLSPATLPWYLTWGFVIAACWAWRPRQLAVIVGLQVFLVLTYAPTGMSDMLYVWPFQALAVAVSVLAGVSLLRVDPLRLFDGRDEAVRMAPAASSKAPAA